MIIELYTLYLQLFTLLVLLSYIYVNYKVVLTI